MCWGCPIKTKPTWTIQGTDNAQDVVGFKTTHGETMKIGDLVILEYTLSPDKIGIVRKLTGELVEILWLRDGDQTWCMQKQVKVVNENR